MALGPKTAAVAKPAPKEAEPETEEDITGLSILDIAEVEAGDIAEVRFERFPVGIFQWEVTDAVDQEKAPGEDEKDPKIKKIFVLDIQLKCIGVQKLAMKHPEPESFVGKKFGFGIAKKIATEADAAAFIGMVKAFCVDVGMDGAQKYRELRDGLVGVQFTAPIKHVRNQNDKDNPYVRLNQQQVAPV